MKTKFQQSTMTSEVEVQFISSLDSVPSLQNFDHWVAAVLAERKNKAVITIRIVDNEESQALNKQYRNKDKPTNVLSFPLADETLPVSMLGDLVICAPVVADEAQQQNKSVEAHWAHMVVHGMLHLLGFEHEQSEEAEQMESLETTILNDLGYADPYMDSE